jgi:hypothetical protein
MGQENDETEAMRVFTDDLRTEAILSHVRGGLVTAAVMDDTPPRQNRLLQLLTDDQIRSVERHWYRVPSDLSTARITLPNVV